MQRITAKTITLQPYVTRALFVLTILCALSAFLYGFFLLEAVAHAASRVSAEREIRDLRTTLASLEGHYLTATKELTPSRAEALGFVPPMAVSTVFANEASPLSLNKR